MGSHDDAADPEIVWRKAASEGEAPADVTLHKQFVPYSVKDAGNRQLTFTISTAVQDRAGDTLAVEGWDLGSFRANPVVLWAHDSSSLPIGRAVSVGARAGALVATAEFTPPELNPLGAQVYELLKAGFLKAVSVGFRPLEWKFNQQGVDFVKQELLEFSVVPVPCNPQALVQARAAGIRTDEIEKWAKAWVTEAPAPEAPVEKAPEPLVEKAGRRHSAATMAALNAAHKAAQDCAKAAGDCMGALGGLMDPADPDGPDPEPDMDPDDMKAASEPLVLKLRPAEVPRPRLTAEEFRGAVVDAVNEAVASAIRRATGRLD